MCSLRKGALNLRSHLSCQLEKNSACMHASNSMQTHTIASVQTNEGAYYLDAGHLKTEPQWNTYLMCHKRLQKMYAVVMPAVLELVQLCLSYEFQLPSKIGFLSEIHSSL